MTVALRGWLKVDFHTHTNEDPKDNIPYNAVELLDRAAHLGFDALAITNHNCLMTDDKLRAYAAEKNILLIPGAEVTCSGKHVLLINPPPLSSGKKLSLADLNSLRREDTLIIAPHPYFPGFKSLFEQLEANHELFDAIEFSAFYNHLCNMNKKAVAVARKYGLPLVASSDAHNLWQLDTAFTMVEAEKTVSAIIKAVKQGRVKIFHHPLSPIVMARILTNFILADKLKTSWRV